MNRMREMIAGIQSVMPQLFHPAQQKCPTQHKQDQCQTQIPLVGNMNNAQTMRFFEAKYFDAI